MDRTVRLQLHPTPGQAIALQETLAQFTLAFNAVCAYGWQHQEKNGVRLHHATYRDTKAACPALVSDLLIQARAKATETVKSEKTYTLNWDTCQMNLASTGGRLHIPLTVPTSSAKYHGCTVATADLCYHRDCDHGLSKRIIQNAAPGSTIVLENLAHIRDAAQMRKGETKGRLHSSSFVQFHQFLAFKAEEQGMAVIKIDPRHTSQTCSKCSFQYRSKRHSQSLFLCHHPACKYCLNADLNASYNIRNKYLDNGPTSMDHGF